MSWPAPEEADVRVMYAPGSNGWDLIDGVDPYPWMVTTHQYRGTLWCDTEAEALSLACL